MPWTKVASDLSTIYGKGYVLVTDYHFKYFEVAHLGNLTDSPTGLVSMPQRKYSAVMKYRRMHVFTDNSPQFIANDNKQFPEEWDFDHCNTSSPRFPQSNGFAEKTMETVKQTLQKAHKSPQDIYLAILILNTTTADMESPQRKPPEEAPAFKMLNRNSRTTLPSDFLSNRDLFPKIASQRNTMLDE